MSYIAAYVAALLLFGLIDAAWLYTMADVLYRPTMGDILLPTVRFAPAVAFYLLYPVGLVIFAVQPGLRTGSLATTALHGLLFGAFAYGTYDLTNHATLKNWALQLTLSDIVYGAITSAVAASAGLLAAHWFGGTANAA